MSKEEIRKKVAYFYDEEVGNFYYGQYHPMKPHRMRLAHSLIVSYGLFKKMEVYRPFRLNENQLTLFHADDYIHFLKAATPENENDWGTDLEKYNIDSDSPIFHGLYTFCQISSGGSVGGAYKLNHKLADIAINWSGGLHHAKKASASGFCYVNDIVLAILELLKYHERVLYIDIDIHHGDGVEEAFFTTDRVMTCSFHKYGNGYFPGSGHINDCGVLNGKNYAINVPLKDGMNDESFVYLFKSIINKVIELYQPKAIVMQCGADSLAGDTLGTFNLTIVGHGQCLQYVKSFNIPMLILGGGGYTIRNVSRCWCYETSICCNQQLNNKLPYNEYYEYFAPDYILSTMPTNMVNYNTLNDLNNTIITVYQRLKQLSHVPSVAMHTDGNRKEYALKAGTIEVRKQIERCYEIIEKHIQKNKNCNNDTGNVVDDVMDDEKYQFKNKQEVDKYFIDKQDENKDVRMTSDMRDKMIMDQREFYDDDNDKL
eukprot:176171_1